MGVLPPTSMKTASHGSADLQPTRRFQFEAWESMPHVMHGPHVHTDIELNLLLCGQAQYFLAGRFHTLPPGRLAAFWAGLPHRLTFVTPDARYLCMTLPLAWFLGWGLDPGFTAHLLEGHLVQEADPSRTALDAALFSGWAGDLNCRQPERRRAALLEVEARLRRLATGFAGSGGETGSAPAADPARGKQMERIAAYVGRHFHRPLSVSDIASAVDLNPNYAMTVFRDGCGLRLWDYVTRLRVSHAQRLLLTTDWTAERIALECGFGSPSRFFATFKKQCGCTPRQYRLR